MAEGKQRQISESIIVGLLLVFVGGYLDGYTYLLRDGMFATMETSNMILAIYHLIHSHYLKGLSFILPIISFTAAVVMTAIVEHFIKYRKTFMHWRQFTLIVEIGLIIGASFIPVSEDLNIYSTLLLAFASGIQLESFRSIESISFAANMATGNLQKIARGFVHGIAKHNRDTLKDAIYFVLILICFIAGITLSLLIGESLGCYTTLFAVIPLLVVFFLLFKKPITISNPEPIAAHEGD